MKQSGGTQVLHTTMVELSEPELIEILISQDGRRVWVNGPGGCLLRAYKVQRIYVADGREDKPHVQT